MRLAALLAVAGALAAAGVLAFTAKLAEAPAQIALSADLAPAQQPATGWSTPAVLNPCPAGPALQVVFPSDKPNHATGAGAIVWSDSTRCPGGEGARLAALGPNDQPLALATPHTASGQPIAPRGALLASGAPHGQILIAGAAPGTSRTAPGTSGAAPDTTGAAPGTTGTAPDTTGAAPGTTGTAPDTTGTAPGTSGDGLLIQGSADGPFTALAPAGGAAAPMALASGYLGDLALVAAPAVHRASRRLGALNVHVERFFAHKFLRNVTASAASAAPVQALTLAMDFRSETLAVWVQGTSMYARVVPNKGGARPIQRLAPVGAHVQIAAVISDDERAIVAWSEQQGDETAVYIDRSATGVRFGAPQLLERFRSPDGLLAPAASPSLVRLSSEGVMLAWAGASAGRWVVRTAPVDLNGVGDVSTIAAPAGSDALLAHLAAGPVGDALLLWTEPLPTAAGAPDVARQAIFAARGFDSYQARSRFGPPEQLAPPAPVSDPTVAIDPGSDRAVTIWRGEADAVEYSIRAASATP